MAKRERNETYVVIDIGMPESETSLGIETPGSLICYSFNAQFVFSSETAGNLNAVFQTNITLGPSDAQHGTEAYMS